MTLREPKTPDVTEYVENIRQEEMLPVGSTALVPVRTLANITGDVRRSHSEAMAGLSASAAKAIEAGEFLLELKKAVRHGQFQDVVTLDCGLKLSTAQMYMKLAAHKDELSQLVAANPQTSRALTQAAALKFLSSAQQKKRRTTKK